MPLDQTFSATVFVAMITLLTMYFNFVLSRFLSKLSRPIKIFKLYSLNFVYFAMALPQIKYRYN